VLSFRPLLVFSRQEGETDVKIEDVKAGMERIYLVAKVVTVGDRRTVETRFGPTEVAIATIEDESGRMNFKLWRKQIDQVKVGDIIRIENAFAITFDGNTELNMGSRGRIEVLARKR
jgi:replication factor A1